MSSAFSGRTDSRGDPADHRGRIRSSDRGLERGRSDAKPVMGLQRHCRRAGANARAASTRTQAAAPAQPSGGESRWGHSRGWYGATTCGLLGFDEHGFVSRRASGEGVTVAGTRIEALPLPRGEAQLTSRPARRSRRSAVGCERAPSCRRTGRRSADRTAGHRRRTGTAAATSTHCQALARKLDM